MQEILLSENWFGKTSFHPRGKREKAMSNLTQEELFIKAQSQFDALLQATKQHTQDQTRSDQAERDLFQRLHEIGHTTLSAFIAGAGDGDEGESIDIDGKTWQRSNETHRRVYHSIFGELEIHRYVYAQGAKKKTYSGVDARLGLPRGEYSYVLEDWLEQGCVKNSFAEGVTGLAAILNVQSTVRTAEVLNRRMAEHAETFRLAQDAPEVPSEAEILVATADGTSVPMHVEDRTKTPSATAGPKAGTTRRAYVGAVYNIEPFVRETDDIMNELFREESSSRRPSPQGKRLWAEMAVGPHSTLFSGSERLFVELAIEVQRRDPDREQVLVCLMDGEQKLWDLQTEWLGRSVEVLDFFHVLKRVRTVSKLAKTDARCRGRWVERQVRDLLEGRVELVIRRWQRLSKKLGEPEDLTSALTYFKNNRDRMRYDEYLSMGYPIGSGVAEGACRNLVKDRMDCTGMHWKVVGARAMLWTRALYLNGEWDEFVEFRIQSEQEQLYQTAA
jgi:hypothetical protein